MKIGIIDYGVGNIFSLSESLNKLCNSVKVTGDREVLKTCDKLILPGVGSASTAIRELKAKNLFEFVKTQSKDVLGICLGMQVLTSLSEENDTTCLDIIPTEVKKFESHFIVPHMGWNQINNLHSGLFKNIEENSYMYFVHSYAVFDQKFSIATCNYTSDFSAAIKKDNFYGVQFHPEKSAKSGEQLLKNFIGL